MNRIGNVEYGVGNPKLVTHVGVTYEKSSPEEEVKKALAAVTAGADIIADASIGKNARKTLQMLCDSLSVPVTVLPGYILCTGDGGNRLKADITKEEILATVEDVLKIGASGITVHSAFRKKHLKLLETSNRSFPFTSRMGNYIRKYMIETGNENPFYLYFADIVKLAKKYHANVSIGIAMRSPSISNNGGLDDIFKIEIEEARNLVAECIKQGVTVSIENGGHISLEKMSEWISFTKETCYGVPMRVLTIASDRGMGHDNVTGAITASYLAQKGVELICTITRAEHIGQPTLEDIVEAVVNYKIALNIVKPNMELEKKVAIARAQGGCHLSTVFDNVIDREGAYRELKKRNIDGLVDKEFDDGQFKKCTMCGDSCPLI